MRLIGLIGKKGAGKNAFAYAANQYLVETGQRAPEIMAFADALKREVAAATNMTLDVIDSNKRQFRAMLQWWGTEFRREMFGHDYWIKRLEESAAWRIHLARLSTPGVNFITDVRFPDEAQFVEANGGILVRIIRPDMDCTDHHSSETTMDQIKASIIVENVGGMDALSSTARNVISGLMTEVAA